MIFYYLFTALYVVICLLLLLVVLLQQGKGVRRGKQPVGVRRARRRDGAVKSDDGARRAVHARCTGAGDRWSTRSGIALGRHARSTAGKAGTGDTGDARRAGRDDAGPCE